MKARLPEGYGPQSKADLMKQYQKLQQNMESMQQEHLAKEYTASAGGKMASATVNGDHQVVSITVDREIVTADDTEMLCDMIAAAVNEAMRAADADYAENMEKLSGGMGGLGALGGMLG